MRKLIHENILAYAKPHLLQEWDYTKNSGLDPNKISYGSNKKAWWKCKKCGYEWETRISHRAIDGSRCKKCSSIYFKNELPLSKSHPHLLKYWDYKKNTSFTPDMIGSGSGKKVWWRCENGHSWESPVYSKVFGSGCPFCSGHSVNQENNIETTHPEIAKEWNYDKNIGISPKDFTKGNIRKVWWICDRGHEWKATINIRTNQKTGCPYCNSDRLSKENNLFIKFPKIAKEWHPIKNGNVNPHDVTPFSHKDYWWKCKNGHEWKTRIRHRTAVGCNCPFCEKIILKDGTAWDSRVEAIFYLKLKEKNIAFVAHGKYGKDLGQKKYDFYLPAFEVYVEITSFNKKYRKWRKYLKRIALKKRYVERKLKKNFFFIEHVISKKDIEYLRKYSL